VRRRRISERVRETTADRVKIDMPFEDALRHSMKKEEARTPRSRRTAK
jgi:hypothetical protein